MTVSAWGHWLIIARLWLPLTGRLPWRLRTFLDDAYDRGVLRQSGPVWEFRHERLQRHLAEPVRGRADPALTRSLQVVRADDRLLDVTARVRRPSLERHVLGAVRVDQRDLPKPARVLRSGTGFQVLPSS